MNDLVEKMKKGHRLGLFTAQDIMTVSAALVYSNTDPAHLLTTLGSLLEQQRVMPKEVTDVK